VDLSALVDDVLQRTVRDPSEKERLQIRVEEGIQVQGDRFALSLALSNLVENALKYSPGGSPVSVYLNKAGSAAVLQVGDQGPGIPEAEKERIFGKFYRIGNEDTRATKGTGLGLFIVKQVLDNHGAEIHVKNNNPSGTVFEIKIDRE